MSRNESLRIWRISRWAERAASVASVGKAAIPSAWPRIPWGMIRMRKAALSAGNVPSAIVPVRNRMTNLLISLKESPSTRGPIRRTTCRTPGSCSDSTGE